MKKQEPVSVKEQPKEERIEALKTEQSDDEDESEDDEVH